MPEPDVAHAHDHQHPWEAPLSRRTVLGAAAGATALTLAGPGRARADRAAIMTAAEQLGRLGAGTDFSVRVSPDGSTLAIDLLGVLWTYSSSGGDATRLTSDLYDIAQPDWSPDGKTLVFQSYRDGVFNLWTTTPDGTQTRQLTFGPYDHREPRYSPDGRYIAFSSDQSGSYGIYTYDTTTGAIAVLVDGTEEEYEPTWSPDGSRIAFVVGDVRIDAVNADGSGRSSLVTVPAGQIIHQPQFLPDGRSVAYHLFHSGLNDIMVDTTPVVTGEEVFPFRVSFTSGNRFYYTANGKVRRRALGSTGAPDTIGFTAAVSTVTPEYAKKRRDFDTTQPQKVLGIGSPVISPDGKSVAFRALNDIYVMRIGKEATPLFRDRWWKSDPDWSPDGTKLAYATDRTGTLNLWVRDLTAGTDQQITFFTDHAAVSCRWSPNGRELAYLDQDGALWSVDVTSGDVQKWFNATFEPGRPTWSKDGNVIALAAVKPYSRRYREGLSKILLVHRQTGEATYVDPAPDRSVQTRGDDGPVWSPDGTMFVFAMESLLWVMPVGADGKPTGPAWQLTTDVSDAPSWAGDSKTVLYLSNGTLKTVKLAGRSEHARDGKVVDVPITWANAPGPERLVVHAGRMWDGTTADVRENVDVLVENHRIVGVEPHRDGRPGQLVDASSRFVMPGIIDIHHHREMQGYAYGSRQGPLWLALGITTTRSPGSPAYHMCEERESVQSGKRVAPRYFGTGEAVDGARIYYNFMRPTFTQEQLGRELARGEGLDYDLMKAYVRLPVIWHKQVIDWSHQRGLPVTSHYHYPAMAYGGDGTEHIGATNRFGYSRTVTNVGSAYSDCIDMFNQSKMARTPTLFGSSTLYREDTSLVTDPRVTRLYPLWRQAALAATVTAAKTTDQTVARANLANQVAQVKAMVEGGGVITTGTDSPIDHLAISTHMNMRACVLYGLTPKQVLITATSNSGAYLGEQIGRIATGYFADLSIVNGDPLADITDAANVTAVVTNGRYTTVEELLAPYPSATTTTPDAPAAAAPSTHGNGRNKVVAPVPNHPSRKGFWWNDPEVLEAARRSCCDTP